MRPSAASVIAGVLRDIVRREGDAEGRERQALHGAARALAALAREMERQRERECEKKRRQRGGKSVPPELAGTDFYDDSWAMPGEAARAALASPSGDELVTELLASLALRELAGEASDGQELVPVEVEAGPVRGRTA